MRPPRPKTLKPAGPPWLVHAHKFAGCRELMKDGTLNPAVRDFFRATKFPASLINTETAWCAAFASSCLEAVSIASPRTAKARHFLTYGYEIMEPRLGALMIFSRGLSSDQAHVGFYDTTEQPETETTYPIFGGNQKNCVCVSSYPKSRLLGIRWPVKVEL